MWHHVFLLRRPYMATSWALLKSPFLSGAGEEALTMYMDKSRLDRKSGNATQSVEALHQLASSYFVDRDGTMRRLHEIQISTGAIKVLYVAFGRERRLCVRQYCQYCRDFGQDFESPVWCLFWSQVVLFPCSFPRVSCSLMDLSKELISWGPVISGKRWAFSVIVM